MVRDEQSSTWVFLGEGGEDKREEKGIWFSLVVRSDQERHRILWKTEKTVIQKEGESALVMHQR